MKQNQWDTYSDLYDKGLGLEGDALHKQLIDPIIFDFLGDYAGKTIVDIGCGNGYLLRKLAMKAKKAIGVDSSKELLKAAEKNLKKYTNVSLIQADVTQKTPLASESADIVIANMILQYLSDLKSVSKEIARILRPNGICISIVDHPGHALFSRAQELAGKKNDKFIDSGSYFSSGKRKKKSLWDKAVLEYYHRPIMEYINPFTKYFYLDQMREVSEDGEMPRILGLKWRKK